MKTVKIQSLLCSQNVGDSALVSFSQNCSNIEKLNLSTCNKLSDKTFHSLASNCIKLHTLDISSCSNLTDHSLKAIGQGCPLVSSGNMYYNILDQIIVKLTSVNISWCDLITQSGIAALSQGCRKLKSFISKVKFHDNQSTDLILPPGMSSHWR